MKVTAGLNHSLVAPDFKEMITITEENGKTVFSINFSSLDLINTCGRKSFYTLERGLKSKDVAAPLAFGSAIHKVMEVWYLSAKKDRILPSKPNEKAQLAANAGLTDDIAFLEKFKGTDNDLFARMFWEYGKSMRSLASLDDSDLRSVPSGIKILNNYFKKFKDDGFEVIQLPDGPMVEKHLRAVMYENSELKIIFHGTLDLGIINPQSNRPCILDHKTARSIGTDFFNRIKPNHQYTGYIWLARKVLGLDVTTFCVNALQTAKTVHNVARQFTERSEEDMQELEIAVIDACKRYLEWRKWGEWPQNSPQPCTMYGGCTFRRVCEVPNALRENIIKSLFDEPQTKEKLNEENQESNEQEESITSPKALETSGAVGCDKVRQSDGSVRFKAL